MKAPGSSVCSASSGSRRRLPAGTGARLRAFLVWLWLATAPTGMADGKVFGRVGLARAEIPDQRALIHWSEGVETLVIETSVNGAGTNFAWVIPLPSAPTEVKPVSTGLFPTLQNIFQARVVQEDNGIWFFGLTVAGFLWLLRCARVSRWRYRDYLASAFLVLVPVWLLLPALAKAKGKGGWDASGRSTLDVIRRDRAGVYEVTTVAARSAGDLLVWLRDHGFEASSAMVPVVEDLLRDGWVFVTARANLPGTNGTSFALHPLSLRFRSPDPVFPMRLTGVENGPVDVDLYVFGPGRAVAEGFRTRYCAMPAYGAAGTPQRRGSFPAGLRIRNPELEGIVGGAGVATKLSGRLDATAMRQDVRPRWAGYRKMGTELQTEPAARRSAAGYASLWLVLGAAVGYGRALAGARNLRLGARIHAAWVGLSLFVWAGAYAAIPKAPAETVVRIPPGWDRQLEVMLRMAALDLTPPEGPAPSADEPLSTERVARLRDLVRAELDSPVNRRWSTNAFTGQPFREEPSPGNYTLLDDQGRLRLTVYDFDGAPTRVP